MSGRARIGLVAGWGRFPIVVAHALRQHDYDVYCLGIKDHADPVLQTMSAHYREVGLGRLGAAIRYFRRHHIQQATMAGKIHKVRLFDRGAWLKHCPDWRGLCTFYPHWISNKRDRRDDTLLTAVVRAYARRGIEFLPATDYAPELLVKYGNLTRRSPSAIQQRDIEFGWRLAKEIGRLDIGQSVAVKGQAPLAVEAIEGTDECIRRAGQLCPQGGFTLVKVAKPQQDMRFDVPTIGLGTVQTLVQAGGKVLAIEADKTIFIDQAVVTEYADRHGLIIVALRDLAAGAAAAPAA